MRPAIDFRVAPNVPEALLPLKDLAENMWWTWNVAARELFRRIDETLWDEVKHNPVALLGRVSQRRLEALASDEGFLHHLSLVAEEFQAYLGGETWFDRAYKGFRKPRFAYFSMEFGIAEYLRIYSGGLGVLAGDHLKSSSDLGVPLVAVGLLFRRGYLSQYLNADGWQQETYHINDPYNLPLELVRTESGAALEIPVRVGDADVRLYVWRCRVGRVDLYLLDANVEANAEDDRAITGNLYGGNSEMRIRQEIVLGIGGLRALHEVGVKPMVCHMNEGHSAFLALERIRLLMAETMLDFESARVICAGGNVFTTHTAVPAGFDLFSADLIARYFGHYVGELGISVPRLLELGRRHGEPDSAPFNMAVFAINNTSYVNGVSELHAQVTRKMMHAGYPGIPTNEVPIRHVTNGVHFETWANPDVRALIERYLGADWSESKTSPEVWKKVERIPNVELWRMHERQRERLVESVRRRARAQCVARNAPVEDITSAAEVLDARALTIGFARRFATYKRATLLFRDIDRLTRLLADASRPVQFIFAGKAHPADEQAKAFIKAIVHAARESNIRSQVIFLEDYDIELARELVAGVDVWLNTPRRPLEASGTSGMKALINGALNCSVLDGWWAEAFVTHAGWAIGAGEEYDDPDYQDRVESSAIYDLLEKEIVPTFYDRARDGLPRRWIEMMKRSMTAYGPLFNTDRMLQQYVRRYYLPAEAYYASLCAHEYRDGVQYAAWRRNVRERWDPIAVNDVTAETNEGRRAGEELLVTANVSLGELQPQDVHVEIYGGVLDENLRLVDGVVTKMTMKKSLGSGRYAYEGIYRCIDVGHHGVLVRVIPAHAMMVAPHALPLVRWSQTKE
ncbi:alpha-glucan family phosphorylase [bacterium]|nr:alpha-glucan family phosphorylase [bacterium]